MTNNQRRILMYILVTCSLCSCGEFDTINIDDRAAKSADSLFRTKTDSLKTLSDSLCLANYEKFYQMAYDSLKEEETFKTIKLVDR